jgi:NAD(P)-dependent dehydrogenase (short-subunit alcohol dehydrogenase family)
MNELLAGRVAVVSGVGPGLGRSMAVELARHGADVVLAARRVEHLEAVGAEIAALGRRAEWLPTDVTVAGDCRQLVAHARETLGRIDVLVNNAFRTGVRHPFLETFDGDDDVWRAAMEVNLWGSLNMTRAVAPLMIEHGEGRVVMIATMAVRDVQARQGPYATSKAALVTAAKTLAKELGPAGIRVNVVVPGYMDGPAIDAWAQLQADQRGVSVETVASELAARHALGYVPDEDEIAGTVVWLASDLARPVTGATIDVNAGYWM